VIAQGNELCGSPMTEAGRESLILHYPLMVRDVANSPTVLTMSYLWSFNRFGIMGNESRTCSAANLSKKPHRNERDNHRREADREASDPGGGPIWEGY
jgi:hypothetical protein